MTEIESYVSSYPSLGRCHTETPSFSDENWSTGKEGSSAGTCLSSCLSSGSLSTMSRGGSLWTVESASVIGREVGGPSTNFIIEVFDGVANWTVLRRYSDFCAVRGMCKTRCSFDAPFPGKSVFRLSGNALDMRQIHLQSYLTSLLVAATQWPALQPIIASFLDCPWAQRWRIDAFPSLACHCDRVGTTCEDVSILLQEEAQQRGSIGVEQHESYMRLLSHHVALTSAVDKHRHLKAIAAEPWVTVDITAHEEASWGEPTSFIILVTPERGEPWFVKRRFSEFSTLRHIMKERGVKVSHKFPKKSLLRVKGPALVQRQVDLHAFLVSLVDGCREEHPQMRSVLTVFLDGIGRI